MSSEQETPTKDKHQLKHFVEINIKKSPKRITDSPDEKARFFGSHKRKKDKNNTWVISLFVVIHVVVFAATMVVNDCPSVMISNRDCAMGTVLGRLSFQPIAENPLLGPSSSTMDRMGALRWKPLMQEHQIWRLVTSPWLHAGVIHLIVNMASVIFVGIYLEEEFGPLRVGLIYILSAFTGSLVASLFIQNSPAVASSGALFGLCGAMLSGLLRNWKVYGDKVAAMVAIFSLMLVSFALGLLPHVNNFANIGGFLSGILLGFVLLFNPHLAKAPLNKPGLFEYNDKTSLKIEFKHKLDKPVLRTTSLLLFSLIVAGGVVAFVHGVEANKYCNWCRYIDCVPSTRWSCNDKGTPCEVTERAGRLTLTCKSTDYFQMYPFTNISEARIGDLCSQLCS